MDADVVIIGAGVIGLAIASALADPRRTLYVLEKNEGFGQETSSRNSEVIHAGLYYIPGSLKARLCIEGNRLLYELCARCDIPHRRLGKLIVANNDEESAALEHLSRNASESGAGELRHLAAAEVRALEPHIEARDALFSAETGIIDSHRLMRHFLASAESRGARIVYRSCVLEAGKVDEGYSLKIACSSSEIFEFTTRFLINAAGLEAHRIAALLGYHFTIHYCKGSYFSVGNGKNRLVSHLVYPPPEIAGLGIHSTLDLGGRMRLGPDVEYTGNSFDYSVNGEKKDRFFTSTSRFLPFLEKDDLEPDFCGIRPKLQGPGEGFRDFEIICDPHGAVHLIGMESPGLTASPAIAAYVQQLLGKEAGFQER